MTTNEPDLPPLPPKWSDPGYLTREAERGRIGRARRALRAFVEHLDAAPSAAVLDALNSALLAYDPPPPEPPADLRDAIVAAMDRHEVVWVDHDTGWECGCNEHGDLGPLPAADQVRRHQADAVMAVVQAHVAAEVERARGAAERALALIAGTSCENSTSGPGACWRDYRDPNAKYGAERWCDPCIALAALTPDATDKLWQEHPGIDQHDEVAAGGERARVEETAREWARIPDQVQGVGNLWEMARKAGSPATLLDEFHRRPGCDVPQPAEPSIDVPGVLNRLKYIEDEVAELREAVEAGDLPGALKEIADVVYTLYGMAWRCRLPLDEAVREVHRSNMTKTASPGDGKAIKGPDYSPADMAAVLAAGGEHRG